MYRSSLNFAHGGVAPSLSRQVADNANLGPVQVAPADQQRVSVPEAHQTVMPVPPHCVPVPVAHEAGMARPQKPDSGKRPFVAPRNPPKAKPAKVAKTASNPTDRKVENVRCLKFNASASSHVFEYDFFSSLARKNGRFTLNPNSFEKFFPKGIQVRSDIKVKLPCKPFNSDYSKKTWAEQDKILSDLPYVRMMSCQEFLLALFFSDSEITDRSLFFPKVASSGEVPPDGFECDTYSPMFRTSTLVERDAISWEGKAMPKEKERVHLIVEVVDGEVRISSTLQDDFKHGSIGAAYSFV